MNKLLTILVGPPGSGKSTWAKDYLLEHSGEKDLIYVNQDSQGKEGHKNIFIQALQDKKDILVDRMNFNKKQREGYLQSAREAGYYTRIVVLHVPKKICLERCIARKGHETIQDEGTARKAIHFFFKSYERVEDSEADEVIRHGWKGNSDTKCVVCDLDGTLANVDHRRHYVRVQKPEKPNWKLFFEEMTKDPVNKWCYEIVTMMSQKYPIVYATGRPADYEDHTEVWLEENGLKLPGSKLFMREAGDYRSDRIVKQNILDFEIKTKYDILFVLDDRQQVVDMWRDNGYIVLQCDNGDF